MCYDVICSTYREVDLCRTSLSYVARVGDSADLDAGTGTGVFDRLRPSLCSTPFWIAGPSRQWVNRVDAL